MEERARGRIRVGRHLFGCPARHHAAAGRASLRPEIDDVIRGPDDVEVVLDHDHGVALVDELVEHVEQLARIFKMQAGCRLIEDVERAAGAPPRQLARQLHTLRLPAAQRRRRLPELDIAEPHVLQRAELGGNRRDVLEQRERLVHGQVEHLGDGLAAVMDLQRLAVVPPALALLARHVDVGQKVHLDRDDAVALAGLAAAALHVEGEPSRLEAARLGLRHHREQLADEGEHAGVRRRVRARRAADRRLIDLDDLVDQLNPFDPIVQAGVGGRPVDDLRQRAVQDVVDECRLAGSADAGDGRQRAERNGHVDVLQVVRPGAANDDLAFERGAPRSRRRNRAFTTEVRPGERAVPILQ